MQGTVEVIHSLDSTPPGRPQADKFPHILLLSSSLLTDRMLQHTRLLENLNAVAIPEVWAMSARNPRFKAVWDSVPTAVKAFPEIRPLREVLNYLRRLNEFAWDYLQRP